MLEIVSYVVYVLDVLELKTLYESLPMTFRNRNLLLVVAIGVYNMKHSNVLPCA